VKGLYRLLKKGWQRKRRAWSGKPPLSVKPPVELFDSIKSLVKDTWDEIHETGNVFLLSKTKISKSRKSFNYCSDTWDSIRNQHIHKFGLSLDYLKYLEAEAEVAEANIQYASSRSKWDKLMLDLAEGDLAGLKSIEPHDPVKETAIIEILLRKENIDTSVISVDKYYTLLGMANKLGVNGK